MRPFADFSDLSALEWGLSLSSIGSYLSIDDIISTNQRLPCRVQSPPPKLASLLGGSILSAAQLRKDRIDDRDVEIAPGAKLEVPFWLLTTIGGSARHIFTLELPAIYKENYREIFAADAWVVDLRKNPYFYSMGCHLAKLSLSETPAVLSMLEEVFKYRLVNLMESALNANKGSVLSLTSKLEELERALFRIGRIGRSSIDQWFSRLHERLVASSIGKEAPAQLADGDEEILEPLPKRHCSHHPSGID